MIYTATEGLSHVLSIIDETVFKKFGAGYDFCILQF